MPDDSTTRSVALLCAHREIEQKIYRMGYALEDGDFELVGGRCEDEWALIDGEWHWTDRYIVVQFKNDLDGHRAPGSHPYS